MQVIPTRDITHAQLLPTPPDERRLLTAGSTVPTCDDPAAEAFRYADPEDRP
jgi:hypothetical protein